MHGRHGESLEDKNIIFMWDSMNDMILFQYRIHVRVRRIQAYIKLAFVIVLKMRIRLLCTHVALTTHKSCTCHFYESPCTHGTVLVQ